MVTIIDLGMGNLRSIEKIFERLKVKINVSAKKDDINCADKLVFPGVGHFGNCMRKLKESDLIDILNKKVLSERTPILGICLGMQLMTKYSEEGNSDGLGWIDGQTLKFKFDSVRDKIPHMGWNHLQSIKQTTMSNDINTESLFYFVHSYYVDCKNKEDILFKTTYNISFVSGFEKDNIVGLQFHPEKSHESGIQLIRNFIEK